MPDTPTAPGTPIPSAKGIVAIAGKQPLPIWLDPDHTGVELYNRKPVRDAAVNFLFWLASVIAPKHPVIQFLEGQRQAIQAWLDRGTK